MERVGGIMHNLSWFHSKFSNKAIYVIYVNGKVPLHPRDDVEKSQQCLRDPLNHLFPRGCSGITSHTKIFGFPSWDLHHSKRLWRDENVMQAKLLTITPPLWKPHTHTNKHSQILITNRSSQLLHHLPLINPLIKQNKITVNPLVSAQQRSHCRAQLFPQGSLKVRSIERWWQPTHSLMPLPLWRSFSVYYTHMHLCFLLLLYSVFSTIKERTLETCCVWLWMSSLIGSGNPCLKTCRVSMCVQPCCVVTQFCGTTNHAPFFLGLICIYVLSQCPARTHNMSEYFWLCCSINGGSWLLMLGLSSGGGVHTSRGSYGSYFGC